jgi:hypothetical protein
VRYERPDVLMNLDDVDDETIALRDCGVASPGTPVIGGFGATLISPKIARDAADAARSDRSQRARQPVAAERPFDRTRLRRRTPSFGISFTTFCWRIGSGFSLFWDSHLSSRRSRGTPRLSMRSFGDTPVLRRRKRRGSTRRPRPISSGRAVGVSRRRSPARLDARRVLRCAHAVRSGPNPILSCEGEHQKE